MQFTVDQITDLAQDATARIDNELRLYGMHMELPPITPGQAREILRVAMEMDLVMPKATFATQPLPQLPAPPAPAPAPAPAAAESKHETRPRKRRQRAPVSQTEIITALRAMAVDGKMPAQNWWDLHKPEGYPSYDLVRRAFGMNWNALAAHIGLQPNRDPGMRKNPRKEDVAAEPADQFPADPVVTARNEIYAAAEKVGHAAGRTAAQFNAALTESTRAVLGPEHTIVTPYRGANGR